MTNIIGYLLLVGFLLLVVYLFYGLIRDLLGKKVKKKVTKKADIQHDNKDVKSDD